MKNKFTVDQLKQMRITYLGSVDLNTDDMNRTYMPVLIKHYGATWNSTHVALLCQCGKTYVRRDHYEQHLKSCYMNPHADPALTLKVLQL